MGRLPSGTLTFLFTDIEGCTQNWENYPEAMNDALAKHDSVLREADADDAGRIPGSCHRQEDGNLYL